MGVMVAYDSICTNGHLESMVAHGYTWPGDTCSICGAKYQWQHEEDVTGGDKPDMRGKVVHIGLWDTWREDRHGNVYAVTAKTYKPADGDTRWKNLLDGK